jgi:hypothetical protein
LEAVATSYSGSKWSSLLRIDSGSGFTTAYNLTEYGRDYALLGDPFRINIPVSQVGNSNTVELKIANNTAESSASSSDKVIYTLLMLSNYSYSNVTSRAEGCIWTVQYDTGSSTGYETVLVPGNYTGTNVCYYNNSKGAWPDCAGVSDDLLHEDAIVQATNSLFTNYLDRNPKDCKLDLTLLDYNVNVLLLPSVPFLYYTRAEFVSWR